MNPITAFRILIAIVGLLFMWTFGSQILGYFFKLLLLFAHKRLTWSPEKDKMSTLKSFSIHTQDGLFGPHWGFGFQHGGRRHFYFHDVSPEAYDDGVHRLWISSKEVFRLP